MRETRDARDVLCALFALQERLGSAPSTQASIEMQLKLRANMTEHMAISYSLDLDRAQARHHDLAEAVLTTAALTEEELLVCRLRYQPDARVSGVETYRRVVRDCDVPTETSGEGEDVLPGTARDHDGKAMPGYTQVRGTRARMRSYDELAKELGWTVNRVRTTIGRALGKVQIALAERQHRRSLDSE